jgi:uncharacterized protein YjiS (DUF1127 family)
MLSNDGGFAMGIQRQFPIRGKRPVGPVSALIESVRQKRVRSRNLAELGALDGSRLQDIGLTEQGRAQIIFSN